ncbi:MAG: amidohydrolase [Actinobacteria bacterium]|nr:amidohydrolase [Actinomycetota bacterium]
MDMNDLILVSVDDHVVEPPGMFDEHLPDRWKAVAPRVVTKDDGTDVWLYEGQELPNIGLNAVSGRPPEEYGIEPTAFADMRDGCHDIDRRIDDMNANGVLGSMCFPSFPQFCGQLFARTDDKEQAIAMVRAYNDWHIDTWCGTHPGRFIPLALPAIWDPALAADEVRRVAAKGCHAVTFSENPEKLGYPSFHSEHWDPLWAACCDEGVVVCLHIGSSSQLVITSVEAPINVMITLQPMNIVQAAADLVWSRVLQEFPALRIALSEGGIGWIPYFLERVDYVYKNHKAWTGQDLGKFPSELFAERIICCFIDDAFGLESLSHLNLDMVTWECDYPHSDSTWPESPELLWAALANAALSEADINRVTHDNAMRLFSFDPFTVRPREECTVGALRKQAAAAGVDTSLVSHGAPPPPEHPIRIIDLAERVTTKTSA